MSSPRGYIKLARKTFSDDPWWGETRTYSRFEAWLDLIQLAQWRARKHATKYGVVALERGEFVASLRWLGARWNWSAMKVTRWLADGVKSGRLTRQSESHAGAVYLIVNYDRYQGGVGPDETVDETDDETDAGQTRDKNKKGKKEKQEEQPAAGPRYPHFSTADCDTLYAAWTALGRPDYGRFRKAFAPLFVASGPVYPVADLTRAIREAIDAAKETGGAALGACTPETFVQRVAHWVEWATAPNVTDDGELTDKGRRVLLGRAA